MKRIKITESQFKKLFNESTNQAPNFNGGDTKQYVGSEVKNSAQIHNMNGDIVNGKEPTTDKISKEKSQTNYWLGNYGRGY